MKRIALALVLPWLIPSAPPLSAQLEGGLDLGFDHTFVWRGLTRVSRPTLQPAVVVAWKTPRLLLSAGGWALLEPWRPRADDLSLAGDELLGELDLWAEARYRLQLLASPADLTAGVVRYRFPGDPTAGALIPHGTATEAYAGLHLTSLPRLYGALGLPQDLPLGVAATAAFDLGGVGGTYLEAGLVAELPVLFVGEPLGATTVRLTSGWSWHQQTASPEGGYYEGEGLTHLALGAGVSPFLHIGPVPATIELAGTVQYGVDEATQRHGLGPDDASRWRAWVHVTLSLLYPLRRQQ